jgi:hypothetical protein
MLSLEVFVPIPFECSSHLPTGHACASSKLLRFNLRLRHSLLPLNRATWILATRSGSAQPGKLPGSPLPRSIFRASSIDPRPFLIEYHIYQQHWTATFEMAGESRHDSCLFLSNLEFDQFDTLSQSHFFLLPKH